MNGKIFCCHEKHTEKKNLYLFGSTLRINERNDHIDPPQAKGKLYENALNVVNWSHCLYIL